MSKAKTFFQRWGVLYRPINRQAARGCVDKDAESASERLLRDLEREWLTGSGPRSRARSLPEARQVDSPSVGDRRQVKPVRPRLGEEQC